MSWGREPTPRLIPAPKPPLLSTQKYEFASMHRRARHRHRSRARWSPRQRCECSRLGRVPGAV